MPHIHSIVYTPASLAEKSRDGYDRAPLAQAKLVEGFGIEGDRKGGHPHRQLNIMCYETLQALSHEGFHVEPGAMGEQIVISGMDLISLSPGARVQVGPSAIVEVVEPRNGCAKFERVQGKSPHLAKRRLGVMARVVSSGVIHVGDTVQVAEAQRAEA